MQIHNLNICKLFLNNISDVLQPATITSDDNDGIKNDNNTKSLPEESFRVLVNADKGKNYYNFFFNMKLMYLFYF